VSSSKRLDTLAAILAYSSIEPEFLGYGWPKALTQQVPSHLIKHTDDTLPILCPIQTTFGLPFGQILIIGRFEFTQSLLMSALHGYSSPEQFLHFAFSMQR
jgi:hypothetical protein